MEQGGGMARPSQANCLEKEGLTSASGAESPTPPRFPEPCLARVGFVHLICGLGSHTAMCQGMKSQTDSMCKGYLCSHSLCSEIR